MLKIPTTTGRNNPVALATRIFLGSSSKGRTGKPNRFNTRTKRIEDIVIGDRILAWDGKRGEFVRRPVLRLFQHGGKPIVVVTMVSDDGKQQQIESTSQHPFWVEGKGWVAASKLQAEDLLKPIDEDDHLRVISSELSGVDADVFNFEVQGVHNYFVGNRGILVHNASSDEDTPRRTVRGRDGKEHGVGDFVSYEQRPGDRSRAPARITGFTELEGVWHPVVEVIKSSRTSLSGSEIGASRTLTPGQQATLGASATSAKMFHDMETAGPTETRAELPVTNTPFPFSGSDPLAISTIASRKMPPLGRSDTIRIEPAMVKAMLEGKPFELVSNHTGGKLIPFIQNNEIVGVNPIARRVPVTQNGYSLDIGYTFEGKAVIQQQATRGCTAAVTGMLITDYGRKIDVYQISNRNLGQTQDMVADIQRAGLTPLVTQPRTMLELSGSLRQYGPAIVTVDGEIGGHVIVADSIDMTRQVATVRDPWHGWSLNITLDALTKRMSFSQHIDAIQISNGK